MFMWHRVVLLVDLLQVLLVLSDHSPDKPLVLTDYIRANKTRDAKNASRVTNLPNSPSFESYSGFVTVDERYNSNLFFWFFPVKNSASTAPVVLYLEGGPGSPSTNSIFGYGPLELDTSLNVKIRPNSWNNEVSMLYVDNPVGTGFSYTDDERGFSRNQTSIADNLYELLQQFYEVFDEYRDNDLYIAGESNGGKYVPTLGYKLMQMANQSELNFKGIAIGDGWIDPINQIAVANRLKSLGLIDLKQYETVSRLEDEIRRLIMAEEWSNATDLYMDMLFGSYKHSLLSKYTGLEKFYNINETMDSYANKVDIMRRYLALNASRTALHAGDRHSGANTSRVYPNLRKDMMISVEPFFTALVTQYKVLLYNGNFDFVGGPEQTNQMLENKNWKYFDAYYSAPRTVYKVSDSDQEVVGYVKTMSGHGQATFSHVILRNTGHGAFDNSRAYQDMFTRFVKDRTYTN